MRTPSPGAVGNNLGGITFGMKPGGVVFGSWPGSKGSPLNHPSKTMPQDRVNRAQSKVKPPEDIVSTSPKIDTEGKQIPAAEKKGFRTSQEFKVDRGIDGGVSPLVSTPVLRTYPDKPTSLRRRTSSGGKSTSPVSRRSSSSGHPISPLTRRKSFGHTVATLLPKTSSEKSIPHLIGQALDHDDADGVMVRSALEDSVSSVKEVQDYFGDLSKYKRPSNDTLSSISPRTSNAKPPKYPSISARDRVSLDGVVSSGTASERSKTESPVKAEFSIKKLETPKDEHVERLPRRLNMPSFVDLLDTAIANYDPRKQVGDGRVTPPRGILNAPYGMDGSPGPPDHHNACYDTDWLDRLSNPVPGSGVYIGELVDPKKTPKNRNVVYMSLYGDGEAVVKALPYNRRGQKISLEKLGEVKKGDIELRVGFGKHWKKDGDDDDDILEEWKKLAKARLDGKNELDNMRELRFAEDVKDLWRMSDLTR
jgi:hypothetical protein